MRDTPPVFASFESLVRFFSDADEIVFQLYFQVGDEQIAALCREGRETAHHLQAHFGARRAADLAAVYGVEVTRARWRAAEDRVVYLGECRLQPPAITLNLDAIEALQAFGCRMAGEEEKRWFSEAQICEAVSRGLRAFHLGLLPARLSTGQCLEQRCLAALGKPDECDFHWVLFF